MNGLPPGFYTDPNGQRRWWDENGWGALEAEIAPPVEVSDAVIQGEVPASGIATVADPLVPRSKRRNGWIWAISAVVVAALLSLTFGVERWEKVIEPEQPETFRSVEVPTGVYDVSMGDSPVCWAGMDWTDCINAHIGQWNYACAERYVNVSSSALCDSYDEMIYEMQSRNAGWGSVVTEVGGWGKLTIAEETKTERVSNNDYVPEKTRTAVCFLWVFFECEWHEAGLQDETRGKVPNAI